MLDDEDGDGPFGDPQWCRYELLLIIGSWLMVIAVVILVVRYFFGGN